MSSPTYSWTCLACANSNPAGGATCANCGCPSSATLAEIRQHAPRDTSADGQLAAAPRLPAEWVEQAANRSRFRVFYWASIALFLLSLASPDGSTLLMLVIGYTSFASGFSLAWVANPLLIAAYLLVPRVQDPWRLRWLLYLAFAATLSALRIDFVVESLGSLRLLPFFAAWLLAPVVLHVGLRRRRDCLLEIRRAGR